MRQRIIVHAINVEPHLALHLAQRVCAKGKVSKQVVKGEELETWSFHTQFTNEFEADERRAHYHVTVWPNSATSTTVRVWCGDETGRAADD